MTNETTVLVDGLMFGESPRWHDGKLWFSDIHAYKVMTADLNGNTETIVEMPTRASGLGWLPDGRLLIATTTTSQLLRLDPDGLSVVADLSKSALMCNDMVVDYQGRAYVGSYGYTLQTVRPGAPAWITLVTPEGDSRVIAEEIDFPNGTVITPDGRTLIIAETFGCRLSAFNIGADGSLTGRRVWAQLGPIMPEGIPAEREVWAQHGAITPDGICLDAEGAIWVASPISSEVLRVHEGGEITNRIKVSNEAFACMLGGPDRRTLFIMTGETSNHEEARAKQSARIEIIEVDIPGAGLP